jgi:hypothetical protein
MELSYYTIEAKTVEHTTTLPIEGNSCIVWDGIGGYKRPIAVCGSEIDAYLLTYALLDRWPNLKWSYSRIDGEPNDEESCK